MRGKSTEQIEADVLLGIASNHRPSPSVQSHDHTGQEITLGNVIGYTPESRGNRSGNI